MRKAAPCILLLLVWSTAGLADVIYSNLSPDGQMAMASRPADPANSKIEIEAADDFILSNFTLITQVEFTGLITGGTLANVNDVNVEAYNIFPADSTTPPDGRVPTRTNSPADVDFADQDFARGLTCSISALSPNFAAANSVLNGINPIPNQHTGGEGPVTGEEVQFTCTIAHPTVFNPGHYFFVPQVAIGGAGEFYWLSAPRPEFTGDLQTWIRNANLDPDWLRVCTDILGSTDCSTRFNAAFEIDGTVVPEPTSMLMILSGVPLVMWKLRKR